LLTILLFVSLFYREQEFLAILDDANKRISDLEREIDRLVSCQI